jgi:NNP family nitrate/nitrite transporter-like MFS transporter
MRLKHFLASGHTPTLASAFLYFDVSFMVWVLIGALANLIAADFQLNDAQKGFLVGVPLLGGAILRLPLGILADGWGGRRAALLSMALTAVPLVLCWKFSQSFEHLLVAALFLGIAGASFAIALPLAGRWYPAEHQGLAMGIAGAGNSGTALAALFAPRLAEHIGWQAVFGAALAPLGAVFVCFYLLAKDSPRQPPPKRIGEYFAVLKEADAWWFCGFYSITFGGFVGLASFLPILFRDQFGLSPVAAGTAAAICVIAGSLLRPLGGYLADRLGGSQVLIRLFLIAAALLVGVASGPPLVAAAALLFLTLSTLGMGNGAVFQLVPNRFPNQVGVITGIVGAAGGLGGFVLPTLLGLIRQGTGSYAVGFVLVAAAAACSAIALVVRGRAWAGLAVSETMRA